MIAVGLDFGTSNSSIARFKDNRIQLFDLDPGNINPKMLRSLIFTDRAQQHFVGAEAITQYMELETGRAVYWERKSMGQVKMVVAGGGSPIVYWDDLIVSIDTNAQGRLIQSIKTALRNPTYEGTDIFDTHYTVESLIAILMRTLKERCEQATGEEVGSVVVGRPVKFSDDPVVDARAQQKIELAAREAGFAEIHFEFEPVAAAYVYHRETAQRENVIVFDFGGGTLDFTVMEVGGSQPPNVLATHGILLGGDDLDRALMQPLRKYFGDGATMRDRTPFPAHMLGMLDSWQTMVLLSRPEYKSVLRSAKRGSDPQSIQRLETLVNKNLGFKLFQNLEQAKIQLSTEATATIRMNDHGLRLREMFTRPQFERLIEEHVVRVEKAIDEALRQSGLQAEQIHAILRTGGTSEIPVFARMLTRKFSYDRIRELSPFATIVGGLAIKAWERTRG